MKRFIAGLLAFLTVWVVGSGALAFAGIMGPHGSVLHPDNRTELERELVYQWLKDYGFDPMTAQNKLAQLSDEEIHELILQSENMGLPYGGGTIELVIGILLVLILIVVLLKLLNKEVVIV